MSSSSNITDLMELSRHLKQEKLFISAEKDQLMTLHAGISANAEQLYHKSWITRQQKIALDRLILASGDATPSACCIRVNSLESANFVDGYRRLTYHETKVGRFLKMLRDTPRLIAACLVHAEANGRVERMHQLVAIVISGLYGNFVMPDDETYALHVIKHLIDLQVSRSADPRRLLRKGSCAFSTVYKILTESLFASRLFLTAALHKPVMQLLMEDEWFYDIDAERALHRFPAADRQRRFGTPGTKEYEKRTADYRGLITDKLVSLVEHFITSLQANMYCFPPSLGWIVSQLYQAVMRSGNVTAAEAQAMCADLVLTFFICPAVCDPEPYGITSDAPISYIARHNLMQVGQILQVLAVSSHEDIEHDSKNKDLYEKFSKGCMSFVLEMLLDGPCSDAPPQNSSLNNFSRAAAILSCSELLELVAFIYDMRNSLNDGEADRKELDDLISSSGLPSLVAIQSLCGGGKGSTGSHSLSIRTSTSPNSTPQATPPSTPVSGKKSVRGRLSIEPKRTFLTPSAAEAGGNGCKGDEITGEEGDGADNRTAVYDDVLVISLGAVNECPGMLSEQKVLEQEVKQKKAKYNSLLPGEDDPVSESDILVHEKRTRFSLSHDQDSIATSDNLEAISEAASSHSVGSDLDNENDNLSDMVSANVSGRGTPNVSGRDTPVSQADSQIEGPDEGGAERQAPAPPNLPLIVQKTNRDDVTDRFGKFDIKQELERDETKSTVSDTWSTDVLASDSEPPEQNQLERLEELAEEPPQNLLLAGIPIQEVLEISETASDAWSTDVLASDTSERQSERLLELDQDDMASVSSRSVGVGSEVNELGDIATDETPQPSGTQSPHLDISDVSSSASPRDPDKIKKQSCGIHGRRHHIDRHAAYDAASTEQSGYRMGRYMADQGDRSSGHARKHHHHTDSSGHSRRGRHHPLIPPPPLNRAPPAPDTKQDILRAFDPLGGGGGVSFLQSETATGGLSEIKCCEENSLLVDCRLDDNNSSDDESNAGGTHSSIGDDNTSPISKAFSDICLSVGGGQGALSVDDLQKEANLDASFHSSSSVGSLVDFSEGGRDAGGVGGQSVPPTMMCSSVSVDTLTSDLPDGLKLMEQQNEKLDEKRLSLSTAFFDPLLEHDNSTMGRDVVNDSILVSTTVQNGVAGHQEKIDLIELGARPKVSMVSSSAGIMPKISVSQVHGNVTTSKSTYTNVPGRIGSKLTTASHSNAAGNLETTGARDDDGKSKKGLFHAFRDRISKGGKRKSTKLSSDRDDVFMPSLVVEADRPAGSESGRLVNIDGPDDLSVASKSKGSGSPGAESTPADTTDDILAKYRKRPVDGVGVANINQSSSGASPLVVTQTGSVAEEEDGPPAYDPSNLENCKAFIDAKRKLRLVLGNADFPIIPTNHSATCIPLPSAWKGASAGGGDVVKERESELVLFLKLQLAEAINLQDKDLVAQLHETIRCLRQFDNQQIRKLLKTMRDEYRGRAPYIAYLVRCRQGLLCSLSVLERLLIRLHRDKTVINKYLLSVFVRLFLEKNEKHLLKFISDFQKLSVSDEKNDLVESFLTYLNKQMGRDSTWQAASDAQLVEARLLIERNIMSHIYTHAMFPNGDGDIMRDQILHEHMKKLSKVISTTHKDLRISKIYQYECPWPAAQTEIYMINAYKTPRDKLQCVLRCSSTIMNLLSMANERSVPAADDFMPVLIYVLIKANPPSLLSTIQYIRGFYEKRLSGEEQYWWMQFVSATEFIKTMDYAVARD